MQIFDKILEITTQIDAFLWGPQLIALLLGTGIYLSIRTGGVQFTQLWKALKLTFSEKARSSEGEGDISPFAALMTGLAATVGNGNIAGVGTAIAIGGPGAPVYMWIAGIVGMSTKYAEGFLGVKYREIAPNGTMAGGPMYYAKNGFKNKKLGKFIGAVFAVCGVVACLIGSGTMAQSNSIAASLANSINILALGGSGVEQAPAYLYYVIGAAIAGVVGLVIIRGIKQIGAFSEKLVPAMIFFYVVFALWVILANFSEIPGAFKLIFASAFGFQPVVGATVGMAVQSGISRGVLSNEAGLGSAAISQGASSSEDPRENGLVAMTSVFIDTIFVNSITTLTIVVTGAYQQTLSWMGPNGENPLTSILVTQSAFDSVIPYNMGGVVIAIASLLFGISTLVGWAYYGEKCIEYLGGDRVIFPYRCLFIIMLFLGAILTPLAGESFEYINIVWNLGNIGNALMAIPNLIGLIFLAKIVGEATMGKSSSS